MKGSLDASLTKSTSRPSAKWQDLFAFTAQSHFAILLPAIILSLLAGLLQPAVAIFFGRISTAFADYGAGRIESSTFMHHITNAVYALIAIGTCTLVLRGLSFSLWLLFGELQAKSARQELFVILLRKELRWYESQAHGTSAVLSSLQT
jgi:ATP-binding cassette subfamily B (MDR/TAP) protein 1